MKRMLAKKWCSGRCPRVVGSLRLSDRASCSTSQMVASLVSTDLPVVYVQQFKLTYMILNIMYFTAICRVKQ